MLFRSGFIPSVAILNSVGHIVAFAAKQLQRYQDKEINTVDLKDQLDRFKRYRDGEKVMSDDQLLTHASSNIFAGSDTTAISLRAIIYFLVQNRPVYKRLQTEIDAANAAGRLSDYITYAECLELPYL